MKMANVVAPSHSDNAWKTGERKHIGLINYVQLFFGDEILFDDRPLLPLLCSLATDFT